MKMKTLKRTLNYQFTEKRLHNLYFLRRGEKINEHRNIYIDLIDTSLVTREKNYGTINELIEKYK